MYHFTRYVPTFLGTYVPKKIVIFSIWPGIEHLPYTYVYLIMSNVIFIFSQSDAI
jgi:hypothetical protein